jgi:D-3-phosphoglycerate dehydrogenase
VKELVLAGLLMSSRGITGGIDWTRANGSNYADDESFTKDVESIKKNFGGRELLGKTVGVAGLGNIGGLVVEAALELGMNVVGYDPMLTVDAAFKLPGDRMERVDSLESLLSKSDYVSLHIPMIKGVTEHMINEKTLKLMKPDASLLNMSRGALVDDEALLAHFAAGSTGSYVTDFPTLALQGHDQVIAIPHLGASTEEAEDVSAVMAADQMTDFIEHGIIRNSVNFPETSLEKRGTSLTDRGGSRLCVFNRNETGALGEITGLLGGDNCNILNMVNQSKGDFAYNVIDLDSVPSVGFKQSLEEIDSVMRVRVISSQGEFE